jgi:putative flippase GtrA
MTADPVTQLVEARAPTIPGTQTLATVDIVIPVLNEERALPGCISTLAAFLGQGFPFPWTVTIVDNGSTDATWQIASDLAGEHEWLSAMRVGIRGRGAALKAAWRASRADIVAYMDVDLSTGLESLLPLVAPLASRRCEIAIGSRLMRGSRVRRSLKREVVSRIYNGMVRHGFGLRCSDAQTGFKAAWAAAVRPLLDVVEDDAWFFDSELLILAEHNGLRIHEVAVDWIEDMDSRVRVRRAAIDNLKGLTRVNKVIRTGRATADVPEIPELRPAHPQAVLGQPRAVKVAKYAAFGVIGIVSTILYTLLYVPLRAVTSPAEANLCALLLVGVCNTEANRHWTFGRRGGPRFILHLRAVALFACTYAMTTLAVVALRHSAPGSGRAAEIAVLILAYGLMTVLRFVVLDRWVFAARGSRGGPDAG